MPAILGRRRPARRRSGGGATAWGRGPGPEAPAPRPRHPKLLGNRRGRFRLPAGSAGFGEGRCHLGSRPLVATCPRVAESLRSAPLGPLWLPRPPPTARQAGPGYDLRADGPQLSGHGHLHLHQPAPGTALPAPPLPGQTDAAVSDPARAPGVVSAPRPLLERGPSWSEVLGSPPVLTGVQPIRNTNQWGSGAIWEVDEYSQEGCGLTDECAGVIREAVSSQFQGYICLKIVIVTDSLVNTMLQMNPGEFLRRT